MRAVLLETEKPSLGGDRVAYLNGGSIPLRYGQICVTIWPNFIDNLPIMVIVTHIWQKLSSVEHDITLIVTNFWQLFSQIFGETMLIVRNIWPNPTSFREEVSP